MYLHSTEFQRGPQVRRALGRGLLFVIGLLTLLSALPVPSLQAHTVALFVNHRTENELVRSAVEAGALEELFNAGHIAFNAVPNRLELNVQGSWQWLRNIAYDMGANYLLWVDSSHAFQGEQFVLESNYVFIEIGRPGFLVEDEISHRENRLLNTFAPEHISYRLGKQLVREILIKIEKNTDKDRDDY